jgi:hypothetical protein
MLLSLKKSKSFKMPFFASTNKLTDSEFKRLTGVKRSSFDLVVEILNIEFNDIHTKNRGRLPKLSMEESINADDRILQGISDDVSYWRKFWNI